MGQLFSLGHVSGVTESSRDEAWTKAGYPAKSALSLRSGTFRSAFGQKLDKTPSGGVPIFRRPTET
jgi:hypothetical protein